MRHQHPFTRKHHHGGPHPYLPGHGNPGPADTWWLPGPGPGRRHGGGGRARKGDVRSVILILLADGPSNGYGLIKAIGEKTGGWWRPSPGSVYPTLQQLVDEGLIASAGSGPRPEYELTDEGRAFVDEHKEHLDSAWNASTNQQHEHGELFAAAGKLMGVIRQVSQAGTPEQRTATATKLDDLRRELYRMLGE
jgi:DNA-binding PadR family transcriptional regulator